MDIQQKLSEFYKVITSESKKKRVDIFFDMENEIKSQFGIMLEKFFRHATQKIESEKLSAYQKTNYEISNKLADTRKSILLLRNKFKNELFTLVENMLYDFVKTNDYVQHIEFEFEKNKYPQPLFEFSKLDKNLFDHFKKNSTLHFFKSKDDFIGGYKVYLNSGKIIIDKSFRSRLENVKKHFNMFRLPNF